MGLQLGDTAPDFVAQTTEGTIRFHEWIGDSWAVLFRPNTVSPAVGVRRSARWLLEVIVGHGRRALRG